MREIVLEQEERGIMSHYYGDIKMSFHGRLDVLRELPGVLEQWKCGMEKLSGDETEEIETMIQLLNKELKQWEKASAEEQGEVSLDYFSELVTVPVAGLCEIARKRPEVIINAEGDFSDSITDESCDYAFFSDAGENSLEGDEKWDDYFLEQLEY